MTTVSSSDDFVMVDNNMEEAGNNRMSLNCFKEYDVVGLNRFTAHAALQFIAPRLDEDNDELRSKVALTAVLDRSGSMAYGKLDLLKIAMHFVREQLQKDDLLGVVVYETNVQESFELTKALPKQQDFFSKKIEEIELGGSTNLSGGLFKGIEQQNIALEKEIIEDKVVQAVLLCTDGHANHGITDATKICEIVKQQISDIPNMCVHTFGFGSDHNPNILRSIAEAGRGKYFYVEKDDSIPDAFGDALGGLLSISAQNIRMVITPLEPSFRVVKIWDKVLDEKTNEDGVVSISLRDMMSEIERKLLFEYSVGETQYEGEQTLALVELMYVNIVSGQNDKVSYILKINRQKEVPEDQPQNEEVLENIARVQTTAKLQEALEHGQKGDVRGGKDKQRRKSRSTEQKQGNNNKIIRKQKKYPE
eukprot:TRINITY_DN1926_c0_g1_i15.p1 TRINITY_DN1926_c0_g1~~TRINITY_DN1926_c0_g1_i15.p1  ORF type:complete len:420 (-),score=85.34 TRINITY_DN1926_c0_g1_i15:50-1309(-)